MQNTLAADVKFLLKDFRAADTTLVSLVYRHENKRFVYSTGQFIEPYQWDAPNQRAHTNQKAKPTRQHHETINAHLDRHRAACLRVMNGLQLAGAAFDNTAIKHHLDNELGRVRTTKPKPVADKETFVQFIARFVADAKEGKRLNAKNSHYAAGTLKNFMKFRNILTDYQQTTRRPLDYEVFTLDFYNRFKKYLTAQGHSLNYVGAVLNGVKMLLKQAHRDGLHENTDYQLRDFKKIEEEVDTIYLTNDELTALYDLDLTHDPKLDRVRDLFMIGCYTGLRFSDYTELRPLNITFGGRILTVTTQKTAARVSIPLNPNVLAILNKYEGVPPRTMSNQKFNQFGAGCRVIYVGGADPHPGRHTFDPDCAKVGTADDPHRPPFVCDECVFGGRSNRLDYEDNRPQVRDAVYEVYQSNRRTKRPAVARPSALFGNQ